MRHGEDDMLPVAVGQDVLLLDDPLFGAFEAAAAAGFGLATLTEEARMGTVRGTAAIASHAHSAGTTGELRSTESLVQYGHSSQGSVPGPRRAGTGALRVAVCT